MPLWLNGDMDDLYIFDGIYSAIKYIGGNLYDMNVCSTST